MQGGVYPAPNTSLVRQQSHVCMTKDDIMKRIGLALLMTAFLAGRSVAQDEAPAESAVGPVIACDEPVYDFGTMDNADTVKHTFVIKNTGDTSLDIERVKPSCGCTVANISQKIIPPGETAEITANMSLKGRNGPISKSIIIHSNDPKQPQFRLALAGTATTAIQVNPDRVFFGQVGPGDATTFNVTLTGVSDTPFSITGTEFTGGTLETEIVTLEEGKSYRINGTLTAPDSPGSFGGNLKITTDHPNRGGIEVPVAGTIVGPLIIAPEEIVLSANHHQPVTRYIVLRAGTVESFTLESVTPPVDTINTKIYPFGDKGYRIQLENILAAPELNGQPVRIVTSADPAKVIEVPFRIVQ